MVSDANQYVLTATCQAKRGVVAALTQCLASHSCYIVSLEQYDDEKTGKFFMRSVFRIESDEISIEDLRAELDSVANDLSINVQLRPAREAMNVLLMVSRFDHCLADLLYRTKKGELNMNIVAVVSNHEDLRPLVVYIGMLL